MKAMTENAYYIVSERNPNMKQLECKKKDIVQIKFELIVWPFKCYFHFNLMNSNFMMWANRL